MNLGGEPQDHWIMANLFADVLISIIRVVIWRWASVLVIKLLTWLDTKIPGRRMKVAIGGALGLAAFILVPVLAGLFGL
jgi:uncharacterized protein YacL